MLPLGCNISFMLLIDQEHFCWTQAVLHADSDLPSMDFNSRSSQCLGVHRGRREQNESRDYWLLYPRLHTALFFILVQYFDHSSVNVCINKLLLSRHLPMTSPKTQKRGKRTMKHLGAMCKLPLTLGPCVSACFCSSSLHAGQQRVPAQGLCTSPPTLAFSSLQQSFHFMLKSQQNQTGAQNRAWTQWHEPPILPKLPDAPGLSPQLRGVCDPAMPNEASFACWLFHPDSCRGRQPDPKLLDCPQIVLHIASPTGNDLCFSAVTMVLTPHLHNTFWNGPWGLVYTRKHLWRELYQ